MIIFLPTLRKGITIHGTKKHEVPVLYLKGFTFPLSVKRNRENRFQRISSISTNITVTCSVSFVVKRGIYEF